MVNSRPRRVSFSESVGQKVFSADEQIHQHIEPPRSKSPGVVNIPWPILRKCLQNLAQGPTSPSPSRSIIQRGQPTDTTHTPSSPTPKPPTRRSTTSNSPSNNRLLFPPYHRHYVETIKSPLTPSDVKAWRNDYTGPPLTLLFVAPTSKAATASARSPTGSSSPSASTASREAGKSPEKNKGPRKTTTVVDSDEEEFDDAQFRDQHSCSCSDSGSGSDESANELDKATRLNTRRNSGSRSATTTPRKGPRKTPRKAPLSPPTPASPFANRSIVATREKDLVIEQAYYIHTHLDELAAKHFADDPSRLNYVVELARANSTGDKNILLERVYNFLLNFLPGSVRFVRNFAIILTDRAKHGWHPSSTDNMNPLLTPGYQPPNFTGVQGHPNVHGPPPPPANNTTAQPAPPPQPHPQYYYQGVPVYATGTAPPPPGHYWPYPPPYPPHPYPGYPLTTVPPNPNTIPRPPVVAPVADPDMPASSLANTNGGTGIEPGFNYFFPAEHVRIFVVKSRHAPWQVTDNGNIAVTANNVPATVTVGELMRGFGCNNPVPKMNRVVEVVPGGNGHWYKGLVISGDDKDMLKKTIREIGWDSNRGGANAEDRPAVFLWFVK